MGRTQVFLKKAGLVSSLFFLIGPMAQAQLGIDIISGQPTVGGYQPSIDGTPVMPGFVIGGVPLPGTRSIYPGRDDDSSSSSTRYSSSSYDSGSSSGSSDASRSSDEPDQRDLKLERKRRLEQERQEREWKLEQDRYEAEQARKFAAKKGNLRNQKFSYSRLSIQFKYAEDGCGERALGDCRKLYEGQPISIESHGFYSAEYKALAFMSFVETMENGNLGWQKREIQEELDRQEQLGVIDRTKEKLAKLMRSRSSQDRSAYEQALEPRQMQPAPSVVALEELIEGIVKSYQSLRFDRSFDLLATKYGVEVLGVEVTLLVTKDKVIDYYSFRDLSEFSVLKSRDLGEIKGNELPRTTPNPSDLATGRVFNSQLPMLIDNLLQAKAKATR